MKRVKAKKELTVKDLDQLEFDIFGDVSKPPIVSPEIVAEIEKTESEGGN